MTIKTPSHFKDEPAVKKESPTLNYAEMNKPKPKPAAPPIDYSNPDMKRDPKKDPNWKQGADKAKMANHTKNNPNIVKGINDQHYVVPPKPDLEKSALPSSPYNNEVEAKIAKLKEKYAEKGPLSMEDKVKNLKDRYAKVKPIVQDPAAAEPSSNPATQDLKDRSKIQKLHSRHRAVKGA